MVSSGKYPKGRNMAGFITEWWNTSGYKQKVYYSSGFKQPDYKWSGNWTSGHSPSAFEIQSEDHKW